MTMQGSEDALPYPVHGDKKAGSLLLLALVIGAAMAARSWLLFGTRYMPGVNGGYYLVQARTLLERGELGFPDLPLIFHLHAALAWMLAKVGGLEQGDAIVCTVKLCDALLPPLAAWPVFALVRRWATARRQGDGVPLAAAALACFAWPWFRMVGDLQKNSLALVWLAALALALHRWLGAPTTKRAMSVLLCLLLLSLTHVGVLGAALVMMAVVTIVFIFRQETLRRRRILSWLGIAVLLLLAAGTFVLWRFDPARIQRLITAFTNPAKFAADGRSMPAPSIDDATLLTRLPSLGFALLVVPGLAIAWRRRKELPPVDLALIAGLGITALAIAGPWFDMDKAVRFYLISLIPAIAVGAFSVLHLTSPWLRQGVCGVALLLGVGSAWPILRAGGKAILSDAAMVELQGLARHVPEPGRTLVCTQHGVEWWTAWFLHTRITQPSALGAADWQHYDSICFLEIKAGMQMPLVPGAPRPPATGPHPSGGADARLPDPSRAGPMMPAPIPPEADILHDGEHVIFARIFNTLSDLYRTTNGAGSD